MSLADYQNHSHFVSLRALILSPVIAPDRECWQTLDKLLAVRLGCSNNVKNKINWHWIVLPWWGFWNFCGVRNFIFDTTAVLELHTMDDSLVNFEHYTQKSTFWVLLGVADTIILLAFVCGEDIIQILFNLSFYVTTHILESFKIWRKHWEKVIWTSKMQTRLLMI